MTVMALENVERKTLRQVNSRMDYWRSEYPDINLFISSFQGEIHIIGSD